MVSTPQKPPHSVPIGQFAIDMPHFGLFAANRVGIRVGVFRGAEISTRPSGSARLGGSAQNPNLVRGPGGRDGHFTRESGSSFLRVAIRPEQAGDLLGVAAESCPIAGAKAVLTSYRSQPEALRWRHFNDMGGTIKVGLPEWLRVPCPPISGALTPVARTDGLPTYLRPMGAYLSSQASTSRTTSFR